MPAASIFVEAGSGQAASRNTVFGSRIVVRVFDEIGEWMPGELVQFALPPTTALPSGRFPGGLFDYTAPTNADGRAESEFIDADGLLGTWLGTASVISAPLVRADFYLSNVDPRGTPATVMITANGDQKVAKNAAYLPVTARLTDGSGVGVASETLALTFPSGHGAFSGGGTVRSVLTDASGYATFPSFVADSTVGDFEGLVAYPALAQAHVFFETVDPLTPTGITVYSGNNQHTPPNFLFAQPLVARVANGINGPVAGYTVTFDAPNAGASLVWTSPATDPAFAVSDVNGLATSPSFSANAVLGTYNVTATLAGFFARSFQLTNGGASPVPDTFGLLISEA